jgi:hypothetical protein
VIGFFQQRAGPNRRNRFERAVAVQGADARKVRSRRWSADRGVIRVLAKPRNLPFYGKATGRAPQGQCEAIAIPTSA